MKSIFLSIVLFIFVIPILAQNNDFKVENEKQNRQRENLETTAALSAESRVLHQLLSNATSFKEELQILNDAVLIGNKRIIPYLKARKEGGYSPNQYLDLALVALGEAQFVDKAIEELKSEDYNVLVTAIWKLARFKTKESYRKLYELLDDNTPRGPKTLGDAIYRTLSEVTKDQLYETVENPPKDQYSTKQWKEWFKKHYLID